MEKPTEVMMEKSTETMMEKPTETMMEKPTEAADGKMTAAPAWFGATLSDASTGNTFTINDFKGKVVLVETMAQWCPNCKQQQTQVKALHELLGMNKDLVSLGLDIDPNENLLDLKNYVTSNGFDWLYAVAPAHSMATTSSTRHPPPSW
jgi:thiol-disulfide isomerase/thioredoxin